MSYMKERDLLLDGSVPGKWRVFRDFDDPTFEDEAIIVAGEDNVVIAVGVHYANAELICFLVNRAQETKGL